MAFTHFVHHELMHQASSLMEPFTRPFEYGANALTPSLLPSAERIMDLALKGWIGEDVAHNYLTGHGIRFDTTAGIGVSGNQASDLALTLLWNQVYWATQELPTVVEQFEIANRNSWSDDRVKASLRRLGYYNDTVRGQIANLRYDIPGPADMVRFSVRHVFEPDLIKLLGYDAEYNEALDLWHQFQGLNYKIWTGNLQVQVNTWEAAHGYAAGHFASLYAAQEVPEPTWARAYWWSHWVLPSPTQGYLMWQRLNPNRDHRFDGPEMLGQDFSFADLQLLLRANDYPPKYRPLLAAISRPIPGIRFVREFRKNDVYDYNDVVGWARRQGYADGDAYDIADDIEAWAIKAQQVKAKAEGLRQLQDAFLNGVISLADFTRYYEIWGATAGEANLQSQILQVDYDARRAREIVGAIRRMYLSGKIDDQQATNLLQQAQLQGQFVTDKLSDWQLEKMTNTRQIAAGKAVQWACKGIISVPELATRLANLGYAPTDVAGMIVEAQQCQVALAAKAAAAQAKAARQQHQQMIAAQRSACQQFQAARRALASHGSPTELRKWYCAGHVGAPELYDRLRFLGWPDTDITRLIDDCKSGTPPPATIPGPGPIQLTGPKPPATPCPPGP